MSENLLEGNWIDVTRPLKPGMSRWPGDPAFELDRFSDMGKGEMCNVSRLSLCVHAGTHIDAPLHFIAGAPDTESAPLDVLMGAVRVIEIRDPVSIRLAELQAHHIRPQERILFKTSNGNIPWEGEFRMNFVYIAADAARYLAEIGVSLVGVDGTSVGGFYHDMVETHQALLGAGIWIVENLDLREIEPGKWDMICLPLRLTGADGAPARVLLRKS